MPWTWPLIYRQPLPELGAPGAFGSRRKYDTHTGVDLYCDEGASVFAVETGSIVAIEQFTGAAAGSPWWNDTWVILMQGSSGVVAYGELSKPEASRIRVGSLVLAQEALGRATRVLIRDKGLPSTMLHLELYAPGTVTTSWWRKSRPEGLMDPTPFLAEAL